MIVYTRLWKTLKDRNISQYELVTKYGISKGLLDRIRKNETVTTYSLGKLCSILECRLDEIAEYIQDERE